MPSCANSGYTPHFPGRDSSLPPPPHTHTRAGPLPNSCGATTNVPTCSRRGWQRRSGPRKSAQRWQKSGKGPGGGGGTDASPGFNAIQREEGGRGRQGGVRIREREVFWRGGQSRSRLERSAGPRGSEPGLHLAERSAGSSADRGRARREGCGMEGGGAGGPRLSPGERNAQAEARRGGGEARAGVLSPGGGGPVPRMPQSGGGGVPSAPSDCCCCCGRGGRPPPAAAARCLRG